MKHLRCFSTFFLVLAVGLAFSIGPSEAAIYKDTFTAQITNVFNSGGGYNPYGLVDNQNFSWYIIYDESTINPAGNIFFTGYYPTNQISVAIPRSGDSPQLFTQLDDSLYDDSPNGNPYGVFSGGQLIELGYYVDQFPLSSPYTGRISVDFFANEIWLESGTAGKYTIIDFDPGYDNYARQVVPIPGAMVMLASGLIALTILRRKQG
jgi:hypothetical protein